MDRDVSSHFGLAISHFNVGSSCGSRIYLGGWGGGGGAGTHTLEITGGGGQCP